MKKIIVAIDSFKGCLSSAEINRTVAQTIKRNHPDYDIIQMPVSDGGEGILDILVKATKSRYVTIQAHDPLMRPIEGRYGISADGRTAYIELASVSGLSKINKFERNPMVTSTYGTGELINDALKRGCREFIIGIGDSATNDAGTGILQALGYKFLDVDGNVLKQGGYILDKISRIYAPQDNKALNECHFTVACDVNATFYGKSGAAYVFGPQKGANAEMVESLDKGLQSFANIIKDARGIDLSNIEGAGAAGGVGGGLHAFLGAELKPGVEIILDTIHFNDIIKDAEIIITGEGRADKQTNMGKVAYGILQIAKQQNVPVVMIAGQVKDEDLLLKSGFKAVYQVSPDNMPFAYAMNPEIAKKNIEQVISVVI